MTYNGEDIGVDLRYKFELKKGYKNIGIVRSIFNNES